MGTVTADYLETINRLPEGSTLILHHVTWAEYERLLEELVDRPGVRVSYDRGRLEVMTPLPEHEEYVRLIDSLVRTWADHEHLQLQNYGASTWKRQRLAKGVEPDACYYVANAVRVIGKRHIDLESDPPPDIVVEIDITNESLSKFPIYATLLVPEIWRYDGKTVQFYQLSGTDTARLPKADSSLPSSPQC